MPIFELERYEIHSQRVRIRADTMAQAIESVMQGCGDNVGELEFIDSCDSFGMTPDKNLKEELNKVGIDLHEGKIAGIRTITRLPEYKHQYDVKICPECSSDLTQPKSICMVYNDGTSATNNATATCLDQTCTLVDVMEIIEKGHHVDTECNKCGKSLSNHEI